MKAPICTFGLMDIELHFQLRRFPERHVDFSLGEIAWMALSDMAREEGNDWLADRIQKAMKPDNLLQLLQQYEQCSWYARFNREGFEGTACEPQHAYLYQILVRQGLKLSQKESSEKDFTQKTMKAIRAIQAYADCRYVSGRITAGDIHVRMSNMKKIGLRDKMFDPIKY